jgi:hypothetical protein
MQGGKNWILPKEINADRFFLRLSFPENLEKTTYVPLWDRMEGVWLWTGEISNAGR